MRLYHGSNMAFRDVDLSVCRPNKDFGQGFYLAPDRIVAERMAKRTVRRFGGKAYLMTFEFDEAALVDVPVKRFPHPSEEWAMFVMANGKRRAIYAINFGSLVEQNGVWNRYKKFLEKKEKRINSGDEQARWMSESLIENQYFREFAFEEASKWFGTDGQDDDIDIIPLYTVCSNKRQMAQSGVELMPRTFNWFDNNLAKALNVSIKEVNDPSFLVSDNISEREDVVSILPAHLVKLVFDPQMEKTTWQFLDQANISAANIYPDLVGIAKSTRYNNNTVVIGNELGDAKESEPILNFCISRDNMVTCSLSDTISSVIDKMVVKRISHVPVLAEEGKVIGVFSESTMMEAWKARLNCAETATISALASLLPTDKHKVDVFEFVSQKASAAALWKSHKESLENDKRIGLFLVTENGKPDEPLFGIATAWDVAEVLDEKEAYSNCSYAEEVIL